MLRSITPLAFVNPSARSLSRGLDPTRQALTQQINSGAPVTATSGGASTTTATTGDYPVLPGAIVAILVASSITHAAAVSTFGTCVVRLVRGAGL